MIAPRIILPLVAVVLLHPGAATGADDLADGFRAPPESARPLVFWQWMNGCVTKEGITADLESFHRVGLGGVQQFLVGGSEAVVTDPTVQVLNPKWRELMRFAIAECARLGLSFGTHNCPGWSASGSPGVQPEDAMKQLVWTVTDAAGGQAFDVALPRPEVDARWNYFRDVAVLAVPATSPVPFADVHQVTAAAEADGTLRCTIPPGRWRIYRLGETLTGSTNGTAPVSGQGLEVDKLSWEALDRFWATYPAQLVSLAGAHAGTVFTRLELDSYEAGPQAWTTNIMAEFVRRCGYDPRSWLPVFAGEVIGSEEMTARFREDWDALIAALFAENYFGHLGELIRRTPGLQFLLEPYATGHGEFFHTPTISGAADALMCEFWSGPTTWGWDSIKPVASAAHTLGKRVVLAEAFTGQPQFAWRVAPFDLKACGDRAFAMGVNRMVLHASAHQPWPALKPGMTMGWWGTQFGPGQTWWEHGGPEWLAYLSRCQFLLQQGTFVADLCYLVRGRVTPRVPAGYDGDALGEQEFLTRLDLAADGRLVLPDGMSYRALVLPDDPVVKLDVLRKVRDLVARGAVVVGPRPERAYGLGGGPEADAEVARIAGGLWGEMTGEHRVGPGEVVAERSPEDVLRELGVGPDVVVNAGVDVVWTHRRVGDADLYFVANQRLTTEQVVLDFRVRAEEVEIWDPATGGIARCASSSHVGAGTRVRLPLEPAGSRFVVFREKPTPGRIDETADAPVEVLERFSIDGPWDVRFPPGRGAPAQVTLPRLESWTEHADDGVQHFSGTATYVRSFDVPERLLQPGHRQFLDLGRVQNIASVTLNGVAFPALWKPPYRVEITSAVRAGHNELLVRVTNLWPNRLIGDEREPDDAEWSDIRTFTYVQPNVAIGRPLLRIPAWVAQGVPRPSAKRVAFTTFDFFNAGDTLLESGLLGPVQIESIEPGATE